MWFLLVRQGPGRAKSMFLFFFFLVGWRHWHITSLRFDERCRSQQWRRKKRRKNVDKTSGLGFTFSQILDFKSTLFPCCLVDAPCFVKFRDFRPFFLCPAQRYWLEHNLLEQERDQHKAVYSTMAFTARLGPIAFLHCYRQQYNNPKISSTPGAYKCSCNCYCDKIR